MRGGDYSAKWRAQDLLRFTMIDSPILASIPAMYAEIGGWKSSCKVLKAVSKRRCKKVWRMILCLRQSRRWRLVGDQLSTECDTASGWVDKVSECPRSTGFTLIRRIARISSGGRSTLCYSMVPRSEVKDGDTRPQRTVSFSGAQKRTQARIDLRCKMGERRFHFACCF